MTGTSHNTAGEAAARPQLSCMLCHREDTRTFRCLDGQIRTFHPACYSDWLGPEGRKALAEASMSKVDALPADWRSLVHDIGWAKVRELREKYSSAAKARACLPPSLFVEKINKLDLSSLGL